MRPVIGITMANDYERKMGTLSLSYLEAVEEAGGTPLPLPSYFAEDIEEYLRLLDGLLLSGGGDPDPFLCQEEPRIGLGSIDPMRDRFEFALVTEALKRDLPVLGICRGMQLLVLACGGELFQDYGETGGVLKHMQDAPRWHPTHSVSFPEGSRLKEIYGCSERRVNSFHHQCVKKTGDILKAAAVSKDGIIEGIESVRHSFVVGVQWHPEALLQKDGRELALFHALIGAVERK